MIVYNVALNMGGVQTETFLAAFHELPIMVPIAFVLEFFVVGKIATILFKDTKDFSTWIQTWAMNFPMAIFYQMFYCGPLVRLIFRTVFREKAIENAEPSIAVRAEAVDAE